MKESKRIVEAMHKFGQNEYWRKRYTAAPSDACAEYIKYDYVNSYWGDLLPEEMEAANKAVEQMTSEDWQHIVDFAEIGPYKIWAAKQRDAVKAREEEEGK